MIEGAVNNALEAVIPLTVSGPAERVSRVDAVVDNGYSGDITLPPDVVSGLGLTRVGAMKLRLANGNEEDFDTYVASVGWPGNQRGVAVHETESEPLVGMSLLEGHELWIEARSAGRVRIDPLPA